MSVTKKALVVALAAAGYAMPAQAAFVLTNTNGGDGYVAGLTASGMDLFGSNNGSGSNYTEYFNTNSGATPLAISFSYIYTTNDCCGAFFDPAGFYNNGVFTQLSPANSAPGAVITGTYSTTVLPGSTYGLYVLSDGELGRADIKVSTAAVPEPAGWATMIVGLGGIGLMRRARKSPRTEASNAAA